MEQVQLVKGIDHPFFLDQLGLDKEQARLTLDDTSISVFTDQPSIVIFTANFGDLGTLYHGKKQVHMVELLLNVKFHLGLSKFRSLEISA